MTEKRIADLTDEEKRERYGDPNKRVKVRVHERNRTLSVDYREALSHPRARYYIDLLKEAKDAYRKKN